MTHPLCLSGLTHSSVADQQFDRQYRRVRLSVLRYEESEFSSYLLAHFHSLLSTIDVVSKRQSLERGLIHASIGDEEYKKARPFSFLIPHFLVKQIYTETMDAIKAGIDKVSSTPPRRSP